MKQGIKTLSTSLRILGVSAVLKSPWSLEDFADDLKPEIKRIAPVVRKLFSDKLIDLVGSGEKIQAYSKAAMDGTSCEIEHALALIHTLKFGNFYREAVNAKAILPSQIIGSANSQINIPLMDKHDTGRRSHYITVQFSIFDAPAHDEFVLALGAATGGRPHHKIGDRYSDLN